MDRTTISLDSELMQAAQRFANSKGQSFSRFVADLLRSHLEANGALPMPDDDRLSRVQAQLAEVMTIEEMEAEIARRTSATVSGEVALIP